MKCRHYFLLVVTLILSLPLCASSTMTICKQVKTLTPQPSPTNISHFVLRNHSHGAPAGSLSSASEHRPSLRKSSDDSSGSGSSVASQTSQSTETSEAAETYSHAAAKRVCADAGDESDSSRRSVTSEGSSFIAGAGSLLVSPAEKITPLETKAAHDGMLNFCAKDLDALIKDFPLFAIKRIHRDGRSFLCLTIEALEAIVHARSHDQVISLSADLKNKKHQLVITIRPSTKGYFLKRETIDVEMRARGNYKYITQTEEWINPSGETLHVKSITLTVALSSLEELAGPIYFQENPKPEYPWTTVVVETKEVTASGMKRAR